MAMTSNFLMFCTNSWKFHQSFIGASPVQLGRKVRVVEAEGSYVMPGGIDPHTHLDAVMFNTVSCDDFAR
jgi:adenine deaminase